METKQTEWERYLESFIQEVTDYKELEAIQFYMKYCVWTWWTEQEDIKEQHTNYLLWEQAWDTDVEDILSYEEWLEEVYYEENQDDIEERIREYREPNLDCIVYKEASWYNDYKIYEVTLACWWPNIYVNLSSRWNNATYEFIWWSEHIEENLSYMYDEIFNYLNLECYDY